MPRVRFLAADKSAEDSVSIALTAAKTGTLAGRGNDPVRQMLDFAARAIGHTRSIAEPGERPWTCSSEETRAETSDRYRCDYERKNRLQKRIFQRNFKGSQRVKGNGCD